MEPYSGEIIKSMKSLVLVTEKKFPNVLGKDTSSVLYLNCSKLFKVSVAIGNCKTKSDLTLNKSLSEHKDVFKDELRTLKDVQSYYSC